MEKINPLIIIRFLVFNGFKLITGKIVIKEKFVFGIMSYSQTNIIKKIYALAFGTQVNDVKVTFSDDFKKNKIKNIKPALDSNNSYKKIECYPEQRFTYIIGRGLKGKELFTYLLNYLYPFNYHPKKNFIYCFGSK